MSTRHREASRRQEPSWGSGARENGGHGAILAVVVDATCDSQAASSL
ncbi:hypothetical protein AKJ09_08246 [Labilithrix luteola]|uniref:Uncharacterized protein n=1 Tax=Labilithrix luteola TaxID=1391654 RepID=A0A0K1Q769_9BACT|nr:hypothetical protein [Labilithrix luteola]AKV01583.1 hypothetical protein AKJ09_08246 [Labilithrix luteola]